MKKKYLLFGTVISMAISLIVALSSVSFSQNREVILKMKNIEALSQSEGIIVPIPCVECNDAECHFSIKDMKGIIYDGYVQDMRKAD